MNSNATCWHKWIETKHKQTGATQIMSIPTPPVGTNGLKHGRIVISDIENGIPTPPVGTNGLKLKHSDKVEANRKIPTPPVGTNGLKLRPYRYRQIEEFNSNATCWHK